MSVIEPLVGRIIEGKYRLEAKIGAGGFGSVYRATHLGLGQAVAVKVLNAGLADSAPETVARFQREAISAFRLKHPNAVTIYDFGVAGDGISYLTMELLEGAPLSYELRRNGPMSPARCAEIVLPVCSVLAEAHAEGVVHRDIKPDNIFLSRTKRGESVKVLDFGIAKLIDHAATNGRDGLTASGGLIGTPAYMSPERLKNQPYDGRADVYSLGIMLYQMLSGKVPFRATDGSNIAAVLLMQINDPPPRFEEFGVVVPPPVAAVVMRALEKEPERRPSVAEFACELAEAVGFELPSFLTADYAAHVQPEISALLALSAEAPTQIQYEPSATPKNPSLEFFGSAKSAEGNRTVPGAERISSDFTTPESIPRATRRTEVAPSTQLTTRRKRAYATAGAAIILFGGGLWGGMRLTTFHQVPASPSEALRNAIPSPQSVSDKTAEPLPPLVATPPNVRSVHPPIPQPEKEPLESVKPLGSGNSSHHSPGWDDPEHPPPPGASAAAWRHWRQRQVRKRLQRRADIQRPNALRED